MSLPTCPIFADIYVTGKKTTYRIVKVGWLDGSYPTTPFSPRVSSTSTSQTTVVLISLKYYQPELTRRFRLEA